MQPLAAAASRPTSASGPMDFEVRVGEHPGALVPVRPGAHRRGETGPGGLSTDRMVQSPVWVFARGGGCSPGFLGARVWGFGLILEM